MVPTPTLPPDPATFYGIEPCSAPVYTLPVKSGVVIAALVLVRQVIFRNAAATMTGCHQPVGSGCWKGSFIGVQKLGELLDILATGTSATEVARLNTNTH